jgi:hypothetical protein
MIYTGPCRAQLWLQTTLESSHTTISRRRHHMDRTRPVYPQTMELVVLYI